MKNPVFIWIQALILDLLGLDVYPGTWYTIHVLGQLQQYWDFLTAFYGTFNFS